MVDSPPRAVYSTITRDRGAQTANHAAPAPATDIKVRFADPHSPRRRPTNENTNGLIREYFPKGTDFNNEPFSPGFVSGIVPEGDDDEGGGHDRGDGRGARGRLVAGP